MENRWDVLAVIVAVGVIYPYVVGVVGKDETRRYSNRFACGWSAESFRAWVVVARGTSTGGTSTHGRVSPSGWEVLFVALQSSPQHA